jgi:hypothetical protein
MPNAKLSLAIIPGDGLCRPASQLHTDIGDAPIIRASSPALIFSFRRSRLMRLPMVSIYVASLS